MDRKQYQEMWNSYQQEREKVQQDPWCLQYHLMPDSGWVNDPNGLCQFQGVYHVYYQYSPFDVLGKTKLWGHYTSKDLIHWKQEEAVLFPDHPSDCHGVYSGSAFIENGKIHYFYTGNVKLVGDYDYINEGREQNTIYVSSEDGYRFSKKEVLLKNIDYPKDISAHVRDPKIYPYKDKYFMVLGARDRSSKGCVLVYESSDLKTWEYKNRIQTKDGFGYMWECPDLFTLEEKSFLITCPQGVKPVGYDYANVHQCGYFPIEYDFENHTYTLGKFYQLDRGFDFYAPQTFEDEQGRRILIGWMGLPDIDYTNPTVERGWQHALTIPRELVVKDGKLLQKPIQEMETLRKSKMVYEGSQAIHIPMDNNVFEMEIAYEQDDSFQMQLRSDMILTYSCDTHTFTLQMGKSGYGRDSRSVTLTTLQTLRIYSDTSSIEIFLNDGEEVFTTRVYDHDESKEIEIKECRSERTITVYTLNGYVIE